MEDKLNLGMLLIATTTKPYKNKMELRRRAYKE